MRTRKNNVLNSECGANLIVRFIVSILRSPAGPGEAEKDRFPPPGLRTETFRQNACSIHNPELAYAYKRRPLRDLLRRRNVDRDSGFGGRSSIRRGFALGGNALLSSFFPSYFTASSNGPALERQWDTLNDKP
jgi:hypothetical protein